MSSAFNELPSAFQTELSFEMYQNMLLQVYIYMYHDVVCIQYSYREEVRISLLFNCSRTAGLITSNVLV